MNLNIETTMVEGSIGIKKFNFNTNPFTFSKNTLINEDFCMLINAINNRNYIKVRDFMIPLRNNTRAFYSIEMKKDLFNLLDSYLVIRRFIQRTYRKNCDTPKRVNELNLLLLPILPKKSLDIVINNSIYCFDITNLLKIYRYTIHDIDTCLYLSGDIEPPKNPYTNIAFSLKENVIIYNAFKKYYISIGRSIPIYLEKLKTAYFDIELYLKYNFNFLMLKSVSRYLNNLSKREFKIEFMTMISASFTTKNNYCRHCYKKVDLYKIFSKTVELYIMNSNNIFTFGNYLGEFHNMAMINNLLFKTSHKKLHRRHIRRYRQRSNITNIESLNTHPMAI